MVKPLIKLGKPSRLEPTLVMSLKRLAIFISILSFSVLCLLFVDKFNFQSNSSVLAVQKTSNAGDFNVKAFGAKGDGKTLDSPAVNIDAFLFDSRATLRSIWTRAQRFLLPIRRMATGSMTIPNPTNRINIRTLGIVIGTTV